MDITTYDGLQATISKYLKGRNDLADQIRTFIHLGEMRVHRLLRVREMLKTATLDGAASIPLPDDFIEDQSIQVEKRKPLEKVAPEDIPIEPIQGEPRCFSIDAGMLRFDRALPSATKLRLRYFARPAFLSDAAPTNAIFPAYSDVILWSAMIETAPYLMDDERVARWNAKFLDALDMANDVDARARLGRVRHRPAYGG